MNKTLKINLSLFIFISVNKENVKMVILMGLLNFYNILKCT